jgi:hypothetical protein
VVEEGYEETEEIEVQGEKEEGYEQEEEGGREVINVVEIGISEDGVAEGDMRVH